MTRSVLLFAVLFTISVVAFNNCSSGFKVDNPMGITNSSSSQCLKKIIADSKAQPLVDPSVCEQAENYQCDLRRFRPGVGIAQEHETQCTNIAGMGQACVSVTTYNFDTLAPAKTAQASDLAEGGAYNRDEVSCVNTQINTKGLLVIQAEGETVLQTLEKTIDSCRQRSHL